VKGQGGGSLVSRATRAVGWSFTNNAAARLGTVGIGIMLARLLGPHAFGTYAVAYVAFLAVISLNDLGVSLAIVRWPGDPARITGTVTTIALLASSVLYVGCYFAAPFYTSALGAPAATPVVRVICIVIVIDGVAAAPAGLLERAFRQDQRMIADQVNVWLGTGVTAALALTGHGAMSLALGRVAGCLAALILLVWFSPEPLRLGFDRNLAWPLLKFGVPLAASGVVVFAVSSVDQLVVGRLLGPTALGFYVLAFNLSSWPVTMFSQPVRAVAPAAFARLQHDPPAMRRGFVSVAGLLGAVSLPVCLLISGMSAPIIHFVYGLKWVPAAQALVWLALFAALRILFELSYDYFVVLASSRVVFSLQLVWLIVLVPALVAGVELRGIWGAGLAQVVVAAGLVLPWYLRELHKVGVRRLDLLAHLWQPLLGAAAAGLAGYAAARFVPINLVALICGGVATLLITGLLVWRMRPVLALMWRSGDQEVT
jgi:O-antigen/teichoic acid export membrane protein